MEVRRLFVNHRADVRKEWTDFLKRHAIREEMSIDYTCAIYEDETIIATGSLYGNIIKCVAVNEGNRGGNTFNILISHLIEEISNRGGEEFYVYTKPEFTQSFEYLGFKVIGMVEDLLVFLERSVAGFDAYLKGLKKFSNNEENNSAIVMNANPFTKGHRFLVETASKNSSVVYLFVVAEDTSEFPFKTRFSLVNKGCEDLKNVIVLSTGNYMVSSQTFPSYFIKESLDVTEIQAKLDASIFKQNIVPLLNIKKRFVGEEPLSVATNIYNKSLKEVLEPEVFVEVIPRREENGDVISASRVRKLLVEDCVNNVKDLVPVSTFDFLTSEDGRKIIESIKTRRK